MTKDVKTIGGKRRAIRRRTPNAGSLPHPRKVTIRLTEKASAHLASIQGLIRAYGKRETLADLWGKVFLPALEAHVKPYAEAAKAARLAAKAAKEAQ